MNVTSTSLNDRSVTVCIKVSNAHRETVHTVESVLRQLDVDLEVVVIHDGATEDRLVATTAATVRSFGDSRIRLLTDTGDRPLASLRNSVVEKSTSAYVTFIDAGERLLPGALAKIIDTLVRNPSAGLAHSYCFHIDETGRVRKMALRDRRAALGRKIPPEIDHRRALIVQGNILQALLTYRRDLLMSLGGFDEKDGDELDYAMALRILDHNEIRLLSEFLCARSAEDSPALSSLASHLRFLAISRRISKAGSASFLTTSSYWFWRLATTGLLSHFRWAGLPTRKSRMLDSTGLATRLARQAISRFRFFFESLYQLVTDRSRWWPLTWINYEVENHRTTPSFGRTCIAYLLWHYPVLSETFVRREIAAVVNSDIKVLIVADAPGDLELLRDCPHSGEEIVYLEPIDYAQRRRSAKTFVRRSPLRCANLLIYLVTHRHSRHKSIRGDVGLFLKASYIAGILQQRQVTHVHAAWADSHAFLALVVSRLLNIPYSVHARAYEVHSVTENFALREKLRPATFAVTNSRYNETHLRPIIGLTASKRLHVIYNGLELNRFRPGSYRNDGSTPLRILAVGRLTQAKGFLYLLKACRLLLDRRIGFTCDIIGGRQPGLDDNTYVLLNKLHRRLELENVVRFAGAQPFSCVLQAYARSDIFVLPCVIADDGRHDITPNALIEAMAMQMAVISTPIGAIPEIVDHEVNGILVPSGDERSLAEALARLAADPDLRQKLGNAARSKIEERFDINCNIKRYAELFRNV